MLETGELRAGPVGAALRDMQDDNETLQGEAAAMVERVGAKLTPAERQKSLLLFKAFSMHGDRGLDIAEDLMDERSPSHPDFDEAEFEQELQRRLQA
jgi:hypothetical protein